MAKPRAFGKKRSLVKRSPPKRKRTPVEVKTSVEQALRADFKKQFSRFIYLLSRNPLTKRVSEPVVREHAFAKTPGKELVDISIDKSQFSVYHRFSWPGEKFSIHSHSPFQGSAEASLHDIKFFLGDILLRGKVTMAISVPSMGPSFEKFRVLSERFRSKDFHDARGGKPRLTVSEVSQLKTVGNAVVNELVISGTVLVQPTKALLNMPKEQITRIIKLVDSKIAGFELLKKKNFAEYLEARNAFLRELSREHGCLFRLRRVPEKGFKYNSRLKAFVRG